MWETILVNLLIGVATVVAAALAKIVNDWNKREKVKDARSEAWFVREETVEALQIGVANVQVDFVDELKRRVATDGKLSKDDIKAARDKALLTATEVLTGPALDWLASLTTNAINGIIDSIVQDKKAR